MAAKKTTKKKSVAPKEVKNEVPMWAAVSLIGGVVTFIAFFTELFGDTRSVIGADGHLYDLHVSYSGIDLITNKFMFSDFAFYKIFPAIIAALAVCVILYSIYGIVASNGKNPAKFPFVILGLTGIVMIVFELIFVFTVLDGNIVTDHSVVVTNFHVGAGMWVMIFGTIVTIAGGMVHLYRTR